MVTLQSVARDMIELAKLDPMGLFQTLRDLEREMCIQLLQEYKGSVTKASRAIGIRRTTMSEKLKNRRVIAEEFRPC